MILREANMNERPVTIFKYLRNILGSMKRHPFEAAFALAGVLTITILYLWIGARLHVIVGFFEFFLPMLMAVLLFEVGAATLRLNRTQQISIATQQTLMDLDLTDRAQSEQNLRAYYLRREDRIHERHEAYVRESTKTSRR